jgi:hypothetical protein
MNESDFVPCPKCKSAFEGAKKLLRQKMVLIGKLEAPMNREVAALYDERIEHLATCEICTCRAWVEGGELCTEGEAIRRNIKRVLLQKPKAREGQ